MLGTPLKLARHYDWPLLFIQQSQNIYEQSLHQHKLLVCSIWGPTSSLGLHCSLMLEGGTSSLMGLVVLGGVSSHLRSFLMGSASRSFSLPEPESNVRSPVKQIQSVVPSSTKEAQTRKHMLWQCCLSELNFFCSHPFIFFSMYVHRRSLPLIII